MQAMRATLAPPYLHELESLVAGPSDGRRPVLIGRRGRRRGGWARGWGAGRWERQGRICREGANAHGLSTLKKHWPERLASSRLRWTPLQQLVSLCNSMQP